MLIELIDITNFAEITSATYMTFSSGSYTFKNATTSNTFLFTPIANRRYCFRINILLPDDALYNIVWRNINIIIEELNR